MTILFGIPNCDTVRKARKWLTAHNVEHRFHDVRKDGLEPEQVSEWARAVGWEILLNRRGQSWRKLNDADKKDIDACRAIALMLQEPTLIKRPVLQHRDTLHVGFSEADYKMLFR